MVVVTEPADVDFKREKSACSGTDKQLHRSQISALVKDPGLVVPSQMDVKDGCGIIKCSG